MTPVGHLSISYCLSRLSRQSATPVCVAGLAPDVDFLLLLIDPERFNDLHRLVTHNVFFVAFVTALLSLRWHRPAILTAAFASGLMHLLIDAVLDGNASNGIGVGLLWPLSTQLWSPFNIFAGWLATSENGWADLSGAVRLALVSLALEFPLAVTAFFLWSRCRRADRDTADRTSD